MTNFVIGKLERKMSILRMIDHCHALAIEKGWWDGDDEHPRSLGDQFANFHAEISEAWEEFRKHHMDPEKFIYYNADKPDKPEGIAVELADCLIRIFDTCGRYNIPLAKALEVKSAYNTTRPHRHGGKHA